MADTTEVAIIGGGAAGCATAYYLAKAGVKATIIERDGVGSQASGFNAGGLNPLQGAGIPGPLGPLAAESFRMHLELAERLPEESGVPIHFKTLTMVNVAFDESELRDMSETLEIFEAAEGFSAHWMETSELLELEPRINPAAIKALHTHGNASLTGYDYTLALCKAAEGMGVKVIAKAVTGLKTSGARVTGVVLEDGEIDCDSVVIATGPWSGDAEEWLGVKIPVQPLKGEIVRVEPVGDPLKQDFSGAGSALYMRADGLVWVGATEADEGFDKEPTQAARKKLLDGAFKIMPTLADARVVKHTACLRPVTADWLPIVGLVPGWDNAYLATGAGKKGILISPGMGKATSDLITRGKTNLPVSGFGLERFA
ncbi:MAG: FAD-dependent oxidoreductase [Chloroflexi bacterium]|nr:FAD-dependent oxidoreductase [Chloroflexota bacterium]